MSCCGPPLSSEEMNEVSRLVSEKLAAFLRTLRGNGFAVGLAEGQTPGVIRPQSRDDQKERERVSGPHGLHARMKSVIFHR